MFVSMETEEGYSRAANYNDATELAEYERYAELLGQEIEIGGASEPSDILWENRHFRAAERFYKGTVVAGIICIMLSISFGFIFWCSKKSNALKGKYPQINCGEFAKEYQGRLDLWQ